MGKFYINTEKTLKYSKDIINIQIKMREIKGQLEQIKSGTIVGGSSEAAIRAALDNIISNVVTNAAKMNNLGDALECIVKGYIKTENAIMAQKANMNSEQRDSGDISNPEIPFDITPEDIIDFLTEEDDDDDYKTDTPKVVEEAYDWKLRKEIKDVLEGNEKYSPENWARASVDERKEILEDYTRDICEVYGLDPDDINVVWDSSLDYTNDEVSWGSYSHSKHRIKLNENALTDNIAKWDSVEMFGTVAHELRHAYQHEAIENPDDYYVSEDTLEEWEDEFDNYIDSDDDYKKYRNQDCEKDARSFEYCPPEINLPHQYNPDLCR